MKQTQGNKSPLNDKLLKYFLKKETKCCRIDKINRLKNSDLLILMQSNLHVRPPLERDHQIAIRNNNKFGLVLKDQRS